MAPIRPKVLVLFGIPGAGKTAISRELQALDTSYLICDSDAIAGSISDITDVDPDVYFDFAAKIFSNLVDANSGASCSFIFTDSLASRSRINKLFGLKNSQNFAVRFVKIKCDPSVALDRVEGRSDPHIVSDSQASLQAKQQLIDSLEIDYVELDNSSSGRLGEKAAQLLDMIG